MAHSILLIIYKDKENERNSRFALYIRHLHGWLQLVPPPHFRWPGRIWRTEGSKSCSVQFAQKVSSVE